MTQPPNQPPQGGFGGPQNPPQSGFGAPQPPAAPPQPGYGQPQQQPGPYAQPGPYGQQPGPYAQQPGPYATPQPGYGYPQQPPQFPGAPTPPPGGGSKNPFKGKPVLAAVSAAAALLLIGGTVYALSGSGGGDKKPVADESHDTTPSPTVSAPVNPGDGSGDGRDDKLDLNAGRKPGEDKVLWYKEAPAVPGNGAEAPGMWITGKAAVKAAYKEVVAYNVVGGNPTWNPVTFPQKICAATAEKTAEDKIVVAYMSGAGDHAKCNQLQEIDLATGKKGWSTELGEGALFDSTISISLTLSGKTLMVGRSQSGTAYDVDSGKKLWDKQQYNESCFPGAFAGGTKLISVAACAAMTNNQHDEVQELDPTTGKAKWTWSVPKGWKVERAFSVAPLVLYLTNEDKKTQAVTALKNNGTLRAQLTSKDSVKPQCSWAILSRDLQGCTGTVADANTLYLPTDGKSGANDVVAFSLETGKERWRVKSPADAPMLPLKLEGTRLIAYVGPTYDAGGQIVSLATTGGNHSPARLLRNSSGAASIESTFYSKAIDYVDGRFYISSTQLTASRQSKAKLMLAYGK